MRTYSIIFSLIGYILLLVSIATTNIYLLTISEMLLIPIAINIFTINFKKLFLCN